MKLFRTLPTARLLVLLGAVVAASICGVAIAIAAGGGGPVPPPKPLADALHDALSSAPPAGVTARIAFTNSLLPTSALPGQVGSPLLSGASGRLWITSDGRGRIELQSNAGDAQITWHDRQVSVYDASSNTDYRLTLPADSSKSPGTTHSVPTVADITSAIQKLSADWALTGAVPADVAGQAAYDVRISPKTNGGLLGAAELAWDAARGVPLKLAIYAKGQADPVLAIAATEIGYGAVPDSDVDVAPPAGAKIVDVPTSGGAGGARTSTPPVTGLRGVQADVSFPIAAPTTLGGLDRTAVRQVGDGASAGALVLYGEGLGTVAVLERPAAAAPTQGALAQLPTVNVGGATAHELATPLGTVLQWTAGSVQTTLAASVTAANAEADAAEVR